MDKLINFRKTLSELKKYLSIPVSNDRDRAGIIQGFEFTFEQSWKSIQKIAAEQGASIGSPKAAFSFAMQNQWILISDEPKWLALLKDRNLTSHTYQEELAHEVIERIQTQYVRMFESLLASLEKL
jgi:nucleotidyltransferase substrate binding protein (TIGR01987 family)